MQRMGPLLCFWTGGIRRAEQKMPQCGIFPPRGERARDCAARSASRPPPVRRIPPSPPRRSKLCIACSGFFHFIPKSRSALTPLLLLSAKGSAWLACSLASALTTARRRCQPFAGPVRAHALHGPSALLLDRWDSKGGTENAAVRHFPAPGASPRPGGAPPREPRPAPVEPRPGGLAPPREERAREQIRPAGGCPAGAARRAAAPCAQTSVSPPANPLRFPRHIISGVTCKSTREPSTAFTAMKSRSGSPSPRSSS